MIEREMRREKQAVMDTIITLSFSALRDSAYKRIITEKLAEARALKVGMTAPDFVIENEKGEKVSLASFRGKVVYLDFWFAACTPCHKLFKEIKPVKENYRKDSSVVFLVVSVDDRETWEKALKTFGIDGYHAFTENKFRAHTIIQNYNVKEYPTTYLIDRDGKVVSMKPLHTSQELMSEIGAALKK